MKVAPSAQFQRADAQAPAVDLALREIRPQLAEVQLQPSIMMKGDLKSRHFGVSHRIGVELFFLGQSIKFYVICAQQVKMLNSLHVTRYFIYIAYDISYFMAVVIM